MYPTLLELIWSAWNINTEARIVLTDMEDLIVLHPPSEKTLGEILYEHVPVTDPSAIRIVIAAYLRRSLPEGLYIDIKPERETLEKMVPSGASVNPQVPLLPDSEVFATHRCHSDLIITL